MMLLYIYPTKKNIQEITIHEKLSNLTKTKVLHQKMNYADIAKNVILKVCLMQKKPGIEYDWDGKQSSAILLETNSCNYKYEH